MTRHFVGETAVLLGRSLRHILRSPDTIITTLITPIAMMLLFVYVFGGAIDTGSDSYVTYLLPGSILLVTIASSISYTAFRLDMQGGIFERFQSLPIARSSVLLGATSITGTPDHRRLVTRRGHWDMIEDSYDLVVSKLPLASRRALGRRGDG